MKIVFLDFDDIRNPLLAGGQAKATNEVGKMLSQKGHDVLVISNRYPGYKDRIEDGIAYRHIGLKSKNIRLNNLFYIFALPFFVSRLKADIIVECFTAPISTLLTPLWTDIPVVAIPSSFEAEQFAKKYRLPFHLVERLGSKLYRYFIAFSEYSERKIKNYNPNIHSVVIPEGVGSEFFDIEKKPAKHILFLGRMDMQQKGIDLLLYAYAKVAHQIPYQLILAGNGPDEQKVYDLVRSLHLKEKVTMTGATFGEKKEKILSESLFVALPSRHETFSLFALEALASGLPIVTFDIQGLSWAGRGALKAPPFDIDAYAQLLKQASGELNMVQLSEDAREFAKQFTWEHVADGFEAFFRTIIAQEKEKKLRLAGGVA